MAKPKLECIGATNALITKITTTVDGGARLTLDLTSIDADIIKQLMDVKLKGTGVIAVTFSVDSLL